MCKAHVLRFSCSHGVLMSLERCNVGPCPVLKTTGVRLPQQPSRCYNCQYRLERRSTSNSADFASSPLRNTTSRSSRESLNSTGSSTSSGSSPPMSSSSYFSRAASTPTHPLPNVAIQPSNCTKLSQTKPSLGRSFSFSCHGVQANHFTTPHYTQLPDFLPHQDHSCPPCQLEQLRAQSDAEVARLARAEYPNLKAEMLVRDGRIWEDWQTKPTLDKYVDEKRTEEREMWLHVTRKWTQDLRKARVLVAEEDGLGLLG